MTPQRPPRTLPAPAFGGGEGQPAHTLLDLDLAAQEGRLAAAPLDPPGGGQ